MTMPPAAAPTVVDQSQRNRLDTWIAELTAGAARWAATGLDERAALLVAVHSSMAANAQRWALIGGALKRLPVDSPLLGEEWMSGPYAALSGAGTLAQTVAALSRGGSPLADVRFGTAPGGRVTVPALPRNTRERLLLHGFSAQVWMPPGKTEAAVRAEAGLGELTPDHNGGVGLVLGAGNITSIPALDVLYELVANNRSSLLKLNPVMGSMLPVFQAALAPLIRFGVLRIIDGGADVGSYLAHHPGIAHVHITGSIVTHDAVVYGPGAAGAERKAANRPLLDKPIASELGGVGPIIVIPGDWTKRDLRFQAEHVATQRLHNGGYNCIAGQLVVLSADWPQRDTFRAELRAAVERAPIRPAWYPGSDDRVRSAATAYPLAERLGPGGGRLLIDLHQGDDAATLACTEYFSPVLGVVELGGTGQAFLDAAVQLANHDLLGTLGANIIATPRTIKGLGGGFWEAVARLRYGTIGINAWTGVGFLTAAAPWGAYPGHTLGDVQSGIGWVHNALLIDCPERTVVCGPFRPFPRSLRHGEFALSPKPPWFLNAKSAATTGRLLSEFAAKPSWAKLPGIFVSAFRA